MVRVDLRLNTWQFVAAAFVVLMASGDAKQPNASEPVIVIGGGLAGLSATLSAVESGASVVLIEGEKNLGGNSAKASSGMAACGTEAQRVKHIQDSTDLFYSDTMNAGDRENDPALVDLIVHKSAEAVEYLVDKGADLTDVTLAGGHSVPRLHWVPPVKEGRAVNVGFAIIKAMSDRIHEKQKEDPDRLRILLNTEAVGIVTWNDYITGVRVKNADGHIDEVSGKAVVLATGGFSSDRGNTSLLSEFASDKLSLPTTNGPFATGRGLKMARAMGAQLVGMQYVQVHPTSFVDPKDTTAPTKFLAAEALRGKGALLVNEKGQRFGNELGRRDYLTGRIMSFCAPNPNAGGSRTAYMLINDAAVDAFGRAAFGFYATVKGFFKKFDNAAELAKHINVEPAVLKKTLDEYNAYAKASKDTKQKDPFGKTIFPMVISTEEPIYVALITPAIHYTMGGLKIDRQAKVFNDVSGGAFKGLFAAGEVTGGVHGRNRLAGNSLLECAVLGRIAGRNAAEVDYSNESPFNSNMSHPDL